MQEQHLWDYEKVKTLLAEEPLPCMLVNLDILAQNVARLGNIAKTHGKTIRLATKSVRVPSLIKYILEKGGDAFEGLMCFSVPEAEFLAKEGLDNFLVAYPTVQPSDLEKAVQLTQQGKTIYLMVDEPAHLRAIENTCEKLGAGPVKVCLDLDVSFRPLGGLLHLGVRRSPLRSVADVSKLLSTLNTERTPIGGVMAYEAQIAGLADRNPFAPLLNPAKSIIKKLSTADVAKKRASVAALLNSESIQLEFFNGGGTGSLATTAKEACVTEVAAGSGFLQSQLFDYYQSNINTPAFCFALQVTRVPENKVVTCQSGGFIASGETGLDKSPRPFLPKGLKPFSTEGFGEVQTPMQVTNGVSLSPGDPVLARPAKAGEIAERFNEYLLIQGNQIVDRAKTYRGLGQAFY